MPHRRDAVDAAVRESTRLVREPWQFRDAVVRRRSFAAAALSLAWLCGALPQGAFRFDVTRGGVNNALTTVARCGGLSVAAVVLLLAARAAAAGVPLSPQDAGFAAGILPIVGAWRYVLADTSAKL